MSRIGLLLAAGTTMVALAPSAYAVRQDKDLHAEIRAIAQADQTDRKMDFTKVAPDELQKIIERDTERLNRIKELLKQGNIETGEDFANASLVFQHGTSVNDYLTAHELSLVRLLKTPRSADSLIVLSEDRFLQKIAQRQRFGTQGAYASDGSKRVVPQPVVEESPYAVTDALRADLCLPPLALYKANGPQLPAGSFDPVIERIKLRYDAKWLADAANKPESKELVLLGGRRAVTVAERDKVLLWYHADQLRTPDDYKNAATVLFTAADTTNLNSEDEASAYLLAHELAMVAAIRGKSKQATKLVTMTMDAFLTRVGLAPRYEIEGVESAAIEPVSNSVRQALGI